MQDPVQGTLPCGLPLPMTFSVDPTVSRIFLAPFRSLPRFLNLVPPYRLSSHFARNSLEQSR
jgi:hypothetical protein